MDPANPIAPPVNAVAPPAADAQVVAPPAIAAPPAAPKTLPYGKANRSPAVATPAAAEVKTDKPASNRRLAMAQANVTKLSAELESARATNKEIDAYKKALSVHASTALNALPKEWQDHIKKLAAGDPRRELELVHETSHLRPASAAAPVAPPAPASTTAATAPKPQTSSDADVAAYQQHETLKVKSPARAATFFFANRTSIDRGMKKSAVS